MKMKLFTLLLALMASGVLLAQMKEGRIVYERTMQMPRMMMSDPNIAAQLPKSRTDQFELLFTNDHSLWQYLPNITNEDPGTVSGNGFVIRMAGGSDDVSYQDFTKNYRVDKREVAEKPYLVTDTITKVDWKLTGDSKTILGHSSQKAIGQRISVRPRITMENGEMKREEFPDTANMVAWYATDIPVPVGPEYQGQLPGAILELDIDKGQMVYHAIEISPKVVLAKIKEPKEGKKLTAAEFRKEREKVMEEMRKNMPPGAVIRMQ